MRRIAVLATICAGLLSAQNTAPKDQEHWSALSFLEGTWDARTQGGTAGASASGTYIFKRELGGHVLARHSSGAGCKGPGDFDCEHGDLLLILSGSAWAAPPGNLFRQRRARHPLHRLDTRSEQCSFDLGRIGARSTLPVGVQIGGRRYVRESSNSNAWANAMGILFGVERGQEIVAFGSGTVYPPSGSWPERASVMVSRSDFKLPRTRGRIDPVNAASRNNERVGTQDSWRPLACRTVRAPRRYRAKMRK